MSTLDGAFGNLHNFLHFVALPNCTDYLLLEAAEQEEQTLRGELADPTKRRISRALFNAVVSLDAVLDYAFHAEVGGPDQRPFNATMFDLEPSLHALREAANAMKHCVTRDPAKLNGSQVVQTTVTADVTLGPGESIGVWATIEAGIAETAKSALGGAFRFWVQQGQKLNALAPRLAR